jgi:aldehyde:ferredoxin oxidoreductase
VTVDELQTVGERSLNLQRAFNAREGLTREDDRLPKKLSKALKGGRSDGFDFTPEDLENAKDAYYALSGWDVASGTPTRAKLDELQLTWVADDLGV